MKRINIFHLLCMVVCLTCCYLLRSVNAKIVYIYNGSIYVMNDNSRNIRRLTGNQFYEGYPRWSPDGTQIAFHRFLDKKNTQIYQLFIMDADGTNQQQLTHSNNAKERIGFPEWSPDGKQIVFDSNRSGRDEIYVMNLQSRKTTQLTGIEKGTGSYTPDWSPDGKQIVFVRSISRGGGLSDKNIWVMEADGQNQKPFLPDPKEAHNVFRAGPRWFPDSQRILYHESTRGLLNNRVNHFVVHHKNGVRKEIDVDEKIGGEWVSWGECLMDNGRSILLSAARLDVPEKDSFHDIYRYEIETGKLRRLTDPTKYPYDDRHPDWIVGPLSVAPQGKKKVTWGTLKR